jgi:hypothetical protein
MKGSKSFALVATIAMAVIRPATADSGTFVQVPGLLKQIAVGSFSVWGVNSRNGIFRFNSNTQQFEQVPGVLAQIAVGGGSLGEDDEVWGVNPSGEVYRFDRQISRFTQVSGFLNTDCRGCGEQRMPKV